MVRRIPCVRVALALCITACNEAPRDDDAGEATPTTASTSGEPGSSGPTSATPTSTSGMPTTETSADSTGIDPTDDPKLDVGTLADFGVDTPAGCSDVEDLPTNQGCEFWAVDLPNVSVAPLAVTPQDQQFAVVVTNSGGGKTANVEVFAGAGENPIDSGAVPPDTVRVFSLPSMSITPGATTDDGTAFRIQSDLPITAYQFQPLDNTNPVYSNDATLLFPTHVLGEDYTALTGDATLASNDAFSSNDVNTGAFVSVVATADGTTVTLFPTATLHPGSVEDVVLDRGEVLTAISSERGAPSYGNLSGTRVVADAPVAVFSGSVATSEPSNNAPCCADHVEHQMLPLTAWGASYVAAPAVSPSGNANKDSAFRITGAFDGTSLTYAPAAPAGAPSSIDAYETVFFLTDEPFTVHSDGGEAFAVSQILVSNQYQGAFLEPGDPTMMLLTATEQFQERYVFLMPQGYATNFLTLVAPSGASLMLDGAAVGGAPAAAGLLDGVAYEYRHVSASAGSHVIEGDQPFGIIVSGHADDVSYGYVGGSGVEVISEPPRPPG